MRCLIVILGALVILTAGCAPESNSVAVRKADTLAPEDVGIEKYVYETKVPAGKVMVFRCTEEGGASKQVRTRETILSTDGDSARQAVLVYDWAWFPFSDRETTTFRVRASTGERIFVKTTRSSRSAEDGRITLEFTDEANVTVKLTYDCFVEEYAATKKRVPGLPPSLPGKRWTYNAPLITK